MFLDLKDGTLCDPRSGDAGEDRRAEHRESYRHVTLLTRRTHSHCNDRRREQGPARYSSVPVEGGSHRVKALTPAHVEKGRLHHPCGSLRQLTAGWVKVGLQRRCLTPCCAALPAPPLTALVAGRLGGCMLRKMTDLQPADTKQSLPPPRLLESDLKSHQRVWSPLLGLLRGIWQADIPSLPPGHVPWLLDKTWS